MKIYSSKPVEIYEAGLKMKIFFKRLRYQGLRPALKEFPGLLRSLLGIFSEQGGEPIDRNEGQLNKIESAQFRPLR